MTRGPTATEQDYLKVIHHLGSAEKGVATADVAARLGVRPASASGMLKRLAEAGWVRHRRGAGARLTPAGVAEARRVIRRHRLVELFLTRVLGLDWSEVDAEADALEHAISPRVERSLAAFLGDPLEDPHGHPIPTPEGELPRRRLKRLAEFRPGQHVLIREADDGCPQRLRRWRELGLVPGAAVEVVGHEPLDDLFGLRVGGHVVAVGSEGLQGLLGEATTDG